jgi:tRNA pseudouridine38-40 synthase
LTLFDPEAEGLSGPGPTAPPPAGGVGRARAAGKPAAHRRTAELAPVPEVTTRLRLDVAYDGTGFHGFAAQHGQRTVAGVLVDALSTVVRHPVALTCAGRTDTGVHAQGQVVHVDVAPGTDLERLVRSVNALVGPEVAVRAAAEVDDGFDARHGAQARTYRYLVHEAGAPDPWWHDRVWTVAGPLDLRSMVAGADALLGEHDFRSFCRRPPDLGPDDPIVRRVLDARWSVADPGVAMVAWGRLLRFDVTATSFCHQMVRSVVGLLVAVGQGRQRAADVHWALRRGDRAGMPDPAPPGGLTLVRVDY